MKQFRCSASSQSCWYKVENNRIFQVGRHPRGSSSPALKWMACTGIKPVTLALLTPCSNWLSLKSHMNWRISRHNLFMGQFVLSHTTPSAENNLSVLIASFHETLGKSSVLKVQPRPWSQQSWVMATGAHLCYPSVRSHLEIASSQCLGRGQWDSILVPGSFVG